MTNTNLDPRPILHLFGDTALQRWKQLYFATPLAFKPPTEAFPWDDLRNIFRGCQWMSKVPNGKEKFPKISTGWVHERYRQTDDRQTYGTASIYIANVNVSSRSLKTTEKRICEAGRFKPGVKKRGSYGWAEWWTMNDVDEEIMEVDSRDKVKHNERRNQLFLEMTYSAVS